MGVDTISINAVQQSSNAERTTAAREMKELKRLNMIYVTHSLQINRYLYLSIHSVNAHVQGTQESEELHRLIDELNTEGIEMKHLHSIRSLYISRNPNIQFTMSIHDMSLRTATELSDEFPVVDLERQVNTIYLSAVDDFDRFYELYKLSKTEDWDNPRNMNSRWNEYHCAKEMLLEQGISSRSIMMVVNFFYDKEKSKLETQEAEIFGSVYLEYIES
jgi:hypothetical protein